MTDKSKQRPARVGYDWQTEGKRSSFNVPVIFIPFLKLIAYKLDSEGITENSIIEVHDDEAEIIIRITKN